MPDVAVPAVASAQAGAFTRDQARLAGWSNKRLARAVAAGLLIRRHADVFVLAGAHALHSEDWAAHLATAPTGVLSGWSAARNHGFQWPQRPRGPACIWVPGGSRRRLDGVVLVRWQVRGDDVIGDAAGRRLTSRPRTVVDCLRLAPRALREGMLDTALLRRWLTIEELAHQVRALHGQHGVTCLRVLLAGVDGGARSRAERLAQQIIQATGIPGWEWNAPIALPDGTTAILDAALRKLRIAVEIDGRAYHSDPDQFQRDRTRQNSLVALGWIVLRFTWWDLNHRPDRVVAAIHAAVASRAA